MKLSTAIFQILLGPLALAGAVPKGESKITYGGYKAFRVATHNNPAAIKEKISKLSAVTYNIDNREHLDVAVPPQEIAAFEALKLEASVLHEDLGADIAKEGTVAAYEGVSAQAVPSLTWFNAYHAYADHVTFFSDLQAAFSNQSELVTAGTSFEGRTIFGIHLWGSGGKGSKPAVYYHGTVHAREWISTKVVEYIAYNLLTQYGTNTTVKAILDKYDFYILPVVNPDGFVYTQTTNRLWRKNRQTRSGQSCVGTDINRNWPYKWELTNGASTNACDETYKGLAAGDSPENKGLVAFTLGLKNSKGIKLFIDWHSYGQYILFPYGYDCSLKPANYALQSSLAAGTAARIKLSYGTSFTYGPSCSTLYATTGDSVDYLDSVGLAQYAWTIELRPTGSGTGGFVLPAAQILPTAIEQWEGQKYLLAAA
ncbi:hypothetical protein B0T22DRAFT_502587 [Podospora appendiculata]|uniref:Peptidase M14 domain-containing protein n=1 Tax=Podospora appendiculata TaxID=314037 RepID=A0AAE0WYW3_9PEZI|nr:hypothetical protein B0T22DRAFT_502587 [Podospora appendiculata]